ncbi:unnamed protein product, partial [Polarella glacialis]
AVARFLPLGTQSLEGAVQAVLGTGNTGYRLQGGGSNIEMNAPEGIASFRSTVFISDTKNHRLIMAPVLEYNIVGCYQEMPQGDSRSVLIPSLEGDAQAGLDPVNGFPLSCGDTMLNIEDAVSRCARAVFKKGWDMFAIRCGG